MRERHTKGVLLILGAAALWGTSGTVQSFATPSLSSYWVGAARLVVAASFFAAWWLVEHGRARGRADGGTRLGARPPALRPTLSARGVWLAAASMTLYNIAFFAGVRASGVALGTALALGSGPLWGGLLLLASGGRTPRVLWWGGVGIAVTGLALALANAEGAVLAPLGVILCLVAGLAYAVYARVTATLVDDASPVAVTALVFGLAAILAVPLAVVLAGPPVIAPRDVPVLLWLGVAATGVAYFLFALGLRHVSSATAVALGMAEPVAAVALAILVVGERPGGVALAGLALVLLGLATIVRGARPTGER